MQSEISLATERNWTRLNVDVSSRLTARANKCLSKKTILPIEYFSNVNNITVVNEILSFVQENGLDTFSVIYTLAVKQLISAGIYNLFHVQNVLRDYPCTINENIYLLLATIYLNYIPRQERY